MSPASPYRRLAGPALLALIVLAALYLVTLVYAVGETLLAGTMLVIVGAGAVDLHLGRRRMPSATCSRASRRR